MLMFIPGLRDRQSGRGRTPPRNLVAAGLMLAAAMVWAAIPAMVDVTDGSSNPFFFNAGWRIGGVIGCLTVLVFGYLRLIIDLVANYRSESLRDVKTSFSLRPRDVNWSKSFGGWAILFGVLGKFEYAFFAFAVGFASFSTVTIIFTIWPILFIFTMAFIYRNNDDRYRHQGGWLILMIMLCFIGFIFVVWPERVLAPGSTFYVGVGIAIFAALIAGSHNAMMLKWADDLGDKIEGMDPRRYQEHTAVKLDVFSAVLGLLITQLICAIASIVIALMLGESISYTLLLLSIIGGIVSGGIADVFFRTSNLIGDNLGVNAIIYAMPVFALAYFVILSPFNILQEIHIARVDYFVVGVLILVVSNLLINSEAEIRKGFRGLILTLGVCGTFVYFREDIFALVGLVQWHWGVVGYFGVVGMSATVFTLLLAFRVGRLISRTDAEENRIFVVFRKLESLAKQRAPATDRQVIDPDNQMTDRWVIDPDILRCVLIIDAPESPTALSDAYLQARRYLTEADYSDVENRKMLVESAADLDALVRSRQSALVLGELFSLVIFGGITIFLVLFSRPQETEGWPRFMVDIFAMLIAPVIVFLMVNIWDLHRERNDKWLEDQGALVGFAVRLPNANVPGGRRADQWLSIILGVGIVATYVGLLAHKWLGWFS